MAAKLTASLRAAPSTVPAFAALALFVVWSTDQAGYPVTHWAPGGLIVLGLLLIAALLVRVRISEMPLAVRIALGALAAYTAFSFLSILWAGVPGDAWEGADRTLLYLLVFALFACWRQTGAGGALLLVAWSLAMAGLALFAALHLDGASSAALAREIPDGRFDYPSGYPNANAAQWLMAFWPAVLLARTPRLHPLVRALLAAGAVVLADVALLSQSRGSLYATPVMVVLVFALLPERRRTFALLVPIGAAVALTARPVLHVGDRLRDGVATSANVHSAVAATLISAVLIALLVGVGAALERRSKLSEVAQQRAGRAIGALALGALVIVLAGGLVAAGNPVTRLEHAWHSFKGGYGSEGTHANRLASGLGSNRYDFYRVSVDEFLKHPVAGIGADNFAQQYLEHGRSTETPHYPHSIELRTLVQTGLIGGLIALTGLIAALAAAWRATRLGDPLARTVAAAALAGFGCWAVHGSFDWFFEFAGLGAPAFAMLGLLCGLVPKSEPAQAGALDDAEARDAGSAAPPQRGPDAVAARRPRRPAERSRGRLARALVPAIAGVGALAVAVTFAGPWLSQLQVQSAARVWTRSPSAAYSRLADAARLNPFSDEAYLVAGSIALRLDEVDRADREFARALKRTPSDAYATLERGAIASTRGERAMALSLLMKAERLDPRDELTRAAARLARSGKTVSVQELNRSILLKAQELS